MAAFLSAWRRCPKASADKELASAPEPRKASAQTTEDTTNSQSPDDLSTKNRNAGALPHSDHSSVGGDEHAYQHLDENVAREVRELIQGTSERRNTKEGFSLTESPFAVRRSLVEPVLARGRTALPLVHAILEDPKSDAVTVYHATYILARLGDKGSAECLRSFLERECEAALAGKYSLAAEPIMGAIRALSEIGHDPHDLGVVRRHLECNNPAIILEAGEALLAWGDDSPDVLEALANAEELRTWGAWDGSTRVRTLCEYFLSERYPTTPRSWQTWKRRHMKDYKSGSFRLTKRTYHW
ncbi:MAG: hypothetical protein HYY17_09570 [Planctomycetes bacterium]|nr:hypothetical protein [Planctomycetota bacterium]